MASENENQDQQQKKPDEQNQDSGDQGKKEDSPEDKRKRRRAIIIFCAVLLVGAIGGLLYWLHARHFEDTDDAQVNGNLSPIGTRVNGTVIKVYVQNNETVKKGDPLVDLDPSDNRASLDQAEAQLAQSRAQLASTSPNVPIREVQNVTNILSAKADVASSEAALAAALRDRDQSAAQVLQSEAANDKAQNDVKRYKILVDKLEISKSDFDQYDSTAKQSAATLQAMRSALQAAERTVNQREAELEQSKSSLQQNEQTATPQLTSTRASVQQARANMMSTSAQLEQAHLNLGYTKIVAPVDGIVMKRSAQVGARVQAGQQLLTISEVGYLWITANFKETQLIHMHPGQHADVHVDALNGDFTGSIETIGGATGSIASTLPPENATGNYVKVVQRIPVRIKLDPNQNGLERLRPGMSVEPTIRID